MLVFLADRRTGDQHATDIGIDDTPDMLKELALQVLPNFVGVEVADLQLSVGGEVLCGDVPLGSGAAVADGCTVNVDLVCQPYLDDLHSGRKRVWEVPLWVSNKADLLKALRDMPEQLASAHITVRTNHEVNLACVQQDGWALQYVDSSLQADREINIAAVQQYGRALEYVHSSLKADREINLAAVQQNGCALQYVHSSLKADREINLAAVQQDGCALQYVHSSLKADREVNLAAVQQNGRALRYVHDSLKDDPEINVAVQQDSVPFGHA